MSLAIHPAAGGFVVADSGTWLPGHYATEAAARHAASLSPDILQAIQDRKNAGDGSAITLDDLATSDDPPRPPAIG